MRKDGRSSSQIRPMRITPNTSLFSTGSALIEVGETKVLCTVNTEDGVPHWLRGSSPASGWLTAEYSMLPGATHTRTRRERNFTGGRTQEIQRLIGRSLRGVMDLTKTPDITFVIDCDVLQADGGTRTASVTGAYVALKLAISKLLRSGRLRQNPLINQVAAVSVGCIEDRILVDLNYDEDSRIDLDMNVVMTQAGKILEIQGTAERAHFGKEQVITIIDAAEQALQGTFELQKIAAEGQIAEG